MPLIENWEEYASMLAGSSLIACAVMLAVSAIFYIGLRLFHLIPRFRGSILGAPTFALFD